jgi:hypothetical protein
MGIAALVAFLDANRLARQCAADAHPAGILALITSPTGTTIEHARQPLRALNLVRRMVHFEAWLTAITGGVLFLTGMLSLVVAPQHWWIGGGLVLIGGVGLGLAATFFAIRHGLGQLSHRSRLLGIAVHTVLLPPGIALYALVSSTPQRGTDGPFADGGQGLVGLLAITYPVVSIVAIGTLLLHRATRTAFSTRR